MKKNLSKAQAREEIDEFFRHIRLRSSDGVRKISRLANAYKIKLGDRRKLFCKKCLSPYRHPKIVIKNDFTRMTCEKCGRESRWKFTGRIRINTHSEVEECC
jgi:RNase P subunit RPR2